MRDFLILVTLFACLPFCLIKPHFGILLWLVVSLLNPHRYSWGVAYYFPVAFSVAVPTILGFIFFSREKKEFPIVRETLILAALFLTFTLTSFLAIYPDLAWVEWKRFSKTLLILFITLILFQDLKRFRSLLMTLMISIGFFGVKGGIFGILTGGQYLVFGPPDSFIADNNSMALAELLILPMLYYFGIEQKNNYIRIILFAALTLTTISVIISYSRGALLTLIAVIIAFILTTNKKILFLVPILLVMLISPFLIPEKWFDRIYTIKTYEEDASALGRINAWWFAFNLAMDHPITGGGFRIFQEDQFLKYAPDPFDVHDAHSIYFEVLAEHGFLGLSLFIFLLISSFLSLRRIHKFALSQPSLSWSINYCKMLRLSLVAFCVGGAFLGLAYFDLYYYIIGSVILLIVITKKESNNLKIQSSMASNII